MAEQTTQYTLLGDAEGNLLSDDEIAGKVTTAATAMSEATDPKSMYAALDGMSADDVRLVVDRCRDRIGSTNIMRIHGCQSQTLRESLVRVSAENVVDTHDVIPPDVKPMVEGWAAEKIRERMVQNLRRSMGAK